MRAPVTIRMSSMCAPIIVAVFPSYWLLPAKHDSILHAKETVLAEKWEGCAPRGAAKVSIQRPKNEQLHQEEPYRVWRSLALGPTGHPSGFEYQPKRSSQGNSNEFAPGDCP